MDATNTTESPAARGLAERVTAIEKILLVTPVVVVEFFIVLSLFAPFVTYEFGDSEVTPSLLTMPFASFAQAAGPDGDSDGAWVGIFFGVAFLVLLLVMITAIISLLRIPGSRQSTRASRFITVIVTLLTVGTACAWLVVAMGVTSADAWTVGSGLPLLTGGTLIALLLTRLPAYRSIWAE